jgi:protein TonB
MKKLFTILLFLLSTVVAKAQKSDTTIYEGCPFPNHEKTIIGEHVVFADVCPQFPGGDKAYSKFLAKNLKWPNPMYDGQGKVILSFIVEKNGTLSAIKIVRKSTPEFDAEALRVIKISPKWIPAKQNHKPVRMRYYLPISFKLA